MTNDQKEPADMKKESGGSLEKVLLCLVGVLVGIIVGVVMLGGLGWVAKQVVDLRVSSAELETKVSQLKDEASNLKVEVTKAASMAINDRFPLEERINQRENHVSAVPEVNSVVPPPPSTLATGRVMSPSSGGEVSIVFNYRIELLNPDETKFYYIANRIGGLYWPKAEIKLRSGVTTYIGTSDEGGSPTDGRFSIVLFEVEKAMHRRIGEWLDRTDDFPGITIDGRELDSVDVVLR